MSYYYTHFGDTQPNSDLSNANLSTIYDPEDEIQTVQAALALFQAIGGNVVDGWGSGRTPGNPPEVTRKGVLVADTRDGLHAVYYPLRTLVRQRSRLWRRRDSEVYSMGLDHWAIARCVSVSEGTVRRAGNAYHLPVSVKFQLISPCWYSTVLHGVEANKWADAPTEFDEFTLDGGELEGAGDSVVVTNGGSIPCTDAIISVTAAAGSPVTAITLSANVCQITWTGTLAENKTLIINCGAKSVLNNYNAAYSGLSFGAQHHTHEWFILEPGANTITVTATTGGTNPVVTFSLFGAVGMSNTVWANVELSNGTVQGIGPLELLSFSHTKRLDRAGSVSFAISGVMGRTYLIQPRRYIRAYGMVGDSATPNVTELGIGIVDSITLNSDYSLSVEGDDLMRELANRNVHDLSLFDDYVRIADESRYGAANDYIERMTDDDPATSSLIDMADGDYWTMGDDAVFDRVRWHLASFNHETFYDPFTFAFEYLNPTGPTWTSFSITDETAVTDDNGRTSIYGRGGDWYWTIPGGWGPAAHNGQTKWWIRWKQTGVNYQGIYCTELRIVHRTGTTQALPTLLQYTGLTGVTPAWTVDTTGHAETSKDVLLTFAGESVLEALIRVAEVTGDHFTLGTGRTIKWFWEADFVNASPVIRCERATTNVKAMESNSEIAILLDCPRVIDTYDLVTRLYPYGGGSGDDRISLKHLPSTKTAPTNYYLDRTNNYLSRPAATNQYGLVEREEVWGDINAETENAAGREAAALKLFDAAFEHLKRFSQPQVIYSLRLAKCERLILPGDKLRIIWHEWRAGQGEHVIDIDALVYALETTVRYDQSGAMTTEVVCSTVDRWPISGETMVIQALERLRHLQAHSTYATQNYVGQQITAGLDDAANVEVRDEQNVVIFRANRVDQVVELGPSTVPHIEYDGAQVMIAGSPVAPILRASATWNPANMVDGAVVSTTVTVTGAATGDVALAAHDQIGANDVIVSAHVQAADTVRVILLNKTGGDLNVASGTLYVTVWKRP